MSPLCSGPEQTQGLENFRTFQKEDSMIIMVDMDILFAANLKRSSIQSQ